MNDQWVKAIEIEKIEDLISYFSNKLRDDYLNLDIIKKLVVPKLVVLGKLLETDLVGACERYLAYETPIVKSQHMKRGYGRSTEPFVSESYREDPRLVVVKMIKEENEPNNEDNRQR